MFGHVLKRDLKRKKTMNAILFAFIVLAAMFMASSLSNIVTVLNGTDYYLDNAGVGDMVVIKLNKGEDSSLERLLETSKVIQNVRTEEFVLAEGGCLSKDQESLITKNTNLIQYLSESGIKYFTENGEEITAVSAGKIMLPKMCAKDNDLKPGDMIHLKFGSLEVDLEYIGYFKDALLGSPMLGNTRILINRELYERIADQEEAKQYYCGRICYFTTKDVDALASELSTLNNTLFTGSRSMIKMCYVMDMIIAAVVLVVAIALIIVSFLFLKFMISFTIQDEFREIGVMKAIGLKNSTVRGLYFVKYLAFAVVGSCLGLVLSIPFGKTLMNIATTNMVLGNKSGFWLNILGGIFVVLAILGYAFRCTGIIKKSSPIDAIRNGETGERYKKKKGLRMEHFPGNATTFMAVNDIKSSPKRYLTIMIAFALCTLMTLIIGNTTSTMKSDKIAHLFGMKQTDMYITSLNVESIDNAVSSLLGGEEQVKENLKQLEELIREKTGYEVEACEDIQYSYRIFANGKEYTVTCQKGINTTLEDYRIYEGVMPASADEIIITRQIADKFDLKIGDTATIKTPRGDKTMLVVAYMEVMNNLGEVIRFHTDFEGDPENISGSSWLQASYKDHPSKAEADRRNEEVSKAFGDIEIMNAQEMCAKNIGVVETMEAVEMFLLGVLIIVIILTVILMETSFVSNEKGQIAMLKAMGFHDNVVIAWQVKRFAIVGLIAVIIATALSIPATSMIITPIFRLMGAKTIHYKLNPLKMFLVYPLITLCATVVVTYIVALKIRHIKANDTSSIE